MTYLWIISIVWAFSFGLIKTYMGGVNPYYLATLRIGISFLFFLPLLRFKKVRFKNSIQLVLLGAVQYGLMYILYLQAFKFLPSWQVAVFTITTPIFVSLIADLLKHKFRWRNLFAATLAFTGGLILKLPGREFDFFVIGFLLVQASNLSFALGQVGYKHLCETSGIENDKNLFGYMYLGGLIVAGLGMLFNSSNIDLTLTTTQILIVLNLGIVASGLSFFFWNLGARKTSIGNLSIMNNMKIPLAIFASTILFHETINIPRFLMGITIISLGFLAQIEPSAKKKLSTESL